MTIKRFNVSCLGPYECCEKYVDECDGGDYILFEDYSVLQARVEKLEKRNANLASRAAAYHNETLNQRGTIAGERRFSEALCTDLQARVERLEACVHALRAIVESADRNQAAVNTALLTDARKALGALGEK